MAPQKGCKRMMETSGAAASHTQSSQHPARVSHVSTLRHTHLHIETHIRETGESFISITGLMSHIVLTFNKYICTPWRNRSGNHTHRQKYLHCHLSRLSFWFLKTSKSAPKSPHLKWNTFPPLFHFLLLALHCILCLSVVETGIVRVSPWQR